MKTTFSHVLLLLLMSFVLTACGDAFMKKSEDHGTDMNQFATRKLDPKALAKFFTHNIREDLLALEDNLNLFIDIVKTDRPKNLSLKELKIYIKKNVKDVGPEVVDALESIFEINSLVFGDDKNYIKKGNVKKLTELLIDINKSIVDNDVYQYFMSEQKNLSFVEHNRRKSKIFSSFSYIATRLNKEFSEKNKVINFVNFLDRFKNLIDNKILSDSHKLLYIKKMFLGGDKEVLTSRELKRFTGMLPDIGKVIFDAIHMSVLEHTENKTEEVLLIMKEDAETLVTNLYYKGQDYVNVMSVKNIFDTLKIFSPQSVKYKKYTNEILKIKGALLENTTPNFNSNEVMILLKDIVLTNLEKGAFYFRMYTANSDILNSGNTINSDLQGITNTENKGEYYKHEFNRIVKTYRYFKGQEFSASFNHSIKRNPLGIFEVSIVEDIVKRLMAAYGTPMTSALGGYRLTQTQLENLMLEYKDFLEGEGITDPGRTKNTAETITLMSSLFQTQSDGDSDIEVNELTEFAVELLSSTSLAKMGDEHFRKYCDPVDDKQRYSVECYRKEFVNMLGVSKKGVEIGDKLGKLKKYLKNSETNVNEYLAISEVFTRSCTHFDDATLVPMNEGELFLLLSGMLAVEQTIIRFDKNNDNVLNPDEVDRAFPIYKSAITALLPDGLTYLAKKVFLYMIKNEKVPSSAAVVGLMLTPQRALRATATRKTLAIILKALSEESPSNKANPFPCETLR